MTINLLLGLLEPTDGCAEVLGFDTCTQADQARSRTGALLEHAGLYEQIALDCRRSLAVCVRGRQLLNRRYQRHWRSGSDPCGNFPAEVAPAFSS